MLKLLSFGKEDVAITLEDGSEFIKKSVDIFELTNKLDHVENPSEDEPSKDEEVNANYKKVFDSFGFPEIVGHSAYIFLARQIFAHRRSLLKKFKKIEEGIIGD